MGTGIQRLSAAALLATIFFTGTSFASPDLISSDSAGVPLENDQPYFDDFSALDVSDNGRYVLLANYPQLLAIGFDNPIFPLGNCNIYRKDRLTDELITVFEGDPEGINYCSGALMSADGNLVATSPGGPLEQECVFTERPEQSGYDCGDIISLRIHDIASGENTDIRTNYFVTSGIYFPLERYFGARIHSFSGQGNVAVFRNLAVFGNSVAVLSHVANRFTRDDTRPVTRPPFAARASRRRSEHPPTGSGYEMRTPTGAPAATAHHLRAGFGHDFFRPWDPG